MDIFLIISGIFVMYQVLRCFLRGTIISLIDLLILLISTIIATSLFGRLSFLFYTTDIYTDARKAIVGMLNYNSIINHEGIITEVVAPDVLMEFIRECVAAAPSTQTFEAIIINLLTNLIVVSTAFLMIFIISYFLLYIVKVIVMPQLKIIEFGTPDKIISIFIGIIKSFTIFYLVMAVLPVIFIEFNYEVAYQTLHDSKTLNFLYNSDPIIKSLFNGVYMK